MQKQSGFQTKSAAFLLLAALSSSSAFAQKKCDRVYFPGLTKSQELVLQNRYKIDPRKVEITGELNLPVILHKTGHETLTPKFPKDAIPVREAKHYDVTVIGGGPAGLTAALYLAEAGKRVLVIERDDKLGGLAQGSEVNGIRAGGGAAYSAGPDGGLQYEIFRKIGLGNYKKKISIEEPIDSYLWNGKLYKGIWEDHTLHELPSAFALFKHALLTLSKKGASQSEGPMAQWADKFDMATMVRMMPDLVASWGDKKSKALYQEFMSDKRNPAKDPMKDVLELLDLYGRSALGGPAREISARQFMDFYESEIYTRYTGTLGTGTVAEALINKLKQYGDLVEFRTSAPVGAVDSARGLTTYLDGNVVKEVSSNDIIFAAPVSIAPHLIKDFDKLDPEKAKAIREVKMTDYAVHVVRVKGHPFRATYDLWIANGGDPTKPTDFILGRWQDPKIKAYEGMREFEKDPADDYGIISIYQPLGASNAKSFTKEENLKMIDKAVREMIAKMDPLVKQDGQKIEIELVESFRWADSIHVVHPGYLEKIPVLARPVGKVRFANGTVSAPELESAMERAALEAKALLGDKDRFSRASGH